jgi:protein-S-isoprenylcysteine O-methyltransferase Ste14
LPLTEEFTKAGNWLFRWRSYLPLSLIAFFLLFVREWNVEGAWFTSRSWEAICLGVSFFGFLIRAHTVGHAPKGTSGRNTGRQFADRVNTTGAYSVVRHPLYVGNYFMGLGVTTFTGVWWMVLIYTLVFWLYYERIMFSEEAFLRDKFGEPYLEWAARTPAFIPSPRRYARPDLSFSFRNVLRREYNGLFAVIVLMSVFDAAGRWSVQGAFSLDRGWTWVLGVSTLAWVVARTIKRHTEWLVVEGR